MLHDHWIEIDAIKKDEKKKNLHFLKKTNLLDL